MVPQIRFWGDALLGDTSLTASTSSPASRHFMLLSVDPENGVQLSGVKEELWVESEASGWRKAESKREGVVADRIRLEAAESQ